MPQTFVTQRRVEFHETDAAGIVHFSSYFLWMEQAEHALLRSVGLRVIDELDGQRISYPRVSATCDYQSPMRFDETFEIQVGIMRLGTSSITYQFRFRQDRREIAMGHMTAVCCKLSDPPTATPIPDRIREALAPFVLSSSD